LSTHSSSRQIFFAVVLSIFFELSADELKDILAVQEARWWSVKIQSFWSKWHFLQYAGRYVRRPPTAKRRISRVSNREVRFWGKDRTSEERVVCSPEEFVDRWSQHLRERYQNAIHNFGLFSPRALRHTSAATRAVLGQKRRSRPNRFLGQRRCGGNFIQIRSEIDMAIE
jgi:hypothetical protein